MAVVGEIAKNLMGILFAAPCIVCWCAVKKLFTHCQFVFDIAVNGHNGSLHIFCHYGSKFLIFDAGRLQRYDRLRNNLYCVEWGVKLYSNQPTNLQRYAFLRRAAVRLSVPSINSRYFDSRLPAIDQYLPASDSSSGQRLTLRTDGRGPTRNCYDTVVLLVV